MNSTTHSLKEKIKIIRQSIQEQKSTEDQFFEKLNNQDDQEKKSNGQTEHEKDDKQEQNEKTNDFKNDQKIELSQQLVDKNNLNQEELKQDVLINKKIKEEEINIIEFEEKNINLIEERDEFIPISQIDEIQQNNENNDQIFEKEEVQKDGFKFDTQIDEQNLKEQNERLKLDADAQLSKQNIKEQNYRYEEIENLQLDKENNRFQQNEQINEKQQNYTYAIVKLVLYIIFVVGSLIYLGNNESNKIQEKKGNFKKILCPACKSLFPLDNTKLDINHPSKRVCVLCHHQFCCKCQQIYHKNKCEVFK